MKVLVTGGAGYIGGHTCVELLNAGHEVVVIDNFVNSKPEALDNIRKITGRDLAFYKADLRDREAVRRIFEEHQIDAAIHFAGLKAVGESVHKPMEYYDNNLGGFFVLAEEMAAHGVKKLVFSSSATVYGMNNPVPFREDYPTSATNPYGYTKVMIEQMLRDLAVADPDWSIVMLRYFNPIGAHKSGRIGEDPKGIPANLVPYVAQVAVGKLDHVNVNGNDYDTPDGTGVRDYIHVVDLALGHIKAVEKVLGGTGCYTYNLGTGKGYSVLDVVRAYEKACGKKIKCVYAPRRPGDIATCYSDPSKAKKELGWEATRGIDEMCEDSWRWQVNNPEGY